MYPASAEHRVLANRVRSLAGRSGRLIATDVLGMHQPRERAHPPGVGLGLLKGGREPLRTEGNPLDIREWAGVDTAHSFARAVQARSWPAEDSSAPTVLHPEDDLSRQLTRERVVTMCSGRPATRRLSISRCSDYPPTKDRQCSTVQGARLSAKTPRMVSATGASSREASPDGGQHWAEKGRELWRKSW